MNVVMIGSGYVGLVSGACFAEFGADVTCVDVDASKIERLQRGEVPIYEPGLDALMARNVAAGRLRFTTELSPAVGEADLVFIAVGTPTRRGDGHADLSYVYAAARDVAKHLEGYTVIVDKSTVPVGTARQVARIVREERPEADFDVASNPEFLREGSAVEDSLHPDRVVFGVESDRARQLLTELYAPLNVPIVATDIQSAELIKHASNSFLAMKISFINAVSRICERSGANIEDVARGMGLDHRIGASFLNAGIGFGGFCFPKDLQAFIRISDKLGYDFRLLKEVENVNEDQKAHFVKRIEEMIWNLQNKTIGVLGLAFKPNTDDMRFAPSIDIIGMLQQEGARVRVYDPVAMDRARAVLRDVTFCDNPYDVAQDADCLAVLTEWDEFRSLDLERIKSMMRIPTLADGRNIFDPATVTGLGFLYKGIGR